MNSQSLAWGDGTDKQTRCCFDPRAPEDLLRFQLEIFNWPACNSGMKPYTKSRGASEPANPACAPLEPLPWGRHLPAVNASGAARYEIHCQCWLVVFRDQRSVCLRLECLPQHSRTHRWPIQSQRCCQAYASSQKIPWFTQNATEATEYRTAGRRE